ncbi:MAG: FAD-dependent oxidoreductase, partial [Eggerthellaceae bacterium]|nr:FAD-dependent oxidoreductase [Eggerthellaceae bacterium]
MNDEDRKAAIEENPLWGNIVCQCCKVSEAELVDALHGPLPVLSFDALKWRCGATMGPCHGGFCTPEIMSIVSRELEINPTALDKRTPGSWLVSQARQNHAELARSKDSFGDDVCKPKHLQYDVVVVGAGAAGMAAAKKASEKGASVLLLDRGERAGGILLQCIHSGFGLHRFKEELTGPEYASREAQAFGGNGPELVPRSTVLSITPRSEEKPTFSIKVASESGMHCLEAKAVVLATGSRERGLGTLNLPGSRPSGVYSAGSAQALINLHGCLPGTKAVVLGSGDIGLIMARRMTLEGMSVEGVYEIADRPSGLRRNIVQCLDDFGIPLHLSKTVTKLEGESRLEAVWISKVDPDTWQPIQGTEERIACDTLVLSIGLEPETELAKQLGVKLNRLTNGADVNQTMSTNIPGIFTCGNALHIHDLADYASSEGDVAGENAARFALDHTEETDNLPVIAGEGVRYAVPQSIQKGILRTSTVSFRVNKTMKRPLMEIVGVRKDGKRDMLAKTKCAVAVPAEMIRMTL